MELIGGTSPVQVVVLARGELGMRLGGERSLDVFDDGTVYVKASPFTFPSLGQRQNVSP